MMIQSRNKYASWKLERSICRRLLKKSTILTLARGSIVGINPCMSASFSTPLPVTDGSKKTENRVIESLDHCCISPDVQWSHDQLNHVPAVQNAFVVQIGNVNIYEEDIASLNAGAWLTDAVRL